MTLWYLCPRIGSSMNYSAVITRAETEADARRLTAIEIGRMGLPRDPWLHESEVLCYELPADGQVGVLRIGYASFQ